MIYLPSIYHIASLCLPKGSLSTESLHPTLSNMPLLSPMVPNHYILKSSFPRFLVKLEMGGLGISRPDYASHLHARFLTTRANLTMIMVLPLSLSIGGRCYSTNRTTKQESNSTTTADAVPPGCNPRKPAKSTSKPPVPGTSHNPPTDRLETNDKASVTNRSTVSRRRHVDYRTSNGKPHHLRQREQ